MISAQCTSSSDIVSGGQSVSDSNLQ